MQRVGSTCFAYRNGICEALNVGRCQNPTKCAFYKTKLQIKADECEVEEELQESPLEIQMPKRRRKTRKQIKSIDTALKIYYRHSEIGNDEIYELFGKMSSSTVAKMKRAVLQRMAEENVKTFVANTVNTEIAFEVWGIDIADLEKRQKKIKTLGLALQ